MSAIKDGRYPITLDKERYLLFSLNVLDEIQDKIGDYTKLISFLVEKDIFRRLKWILTLLINEGAEPGDEPLTEYQVGKLVYPKNLILVENAIVKAFEFSVIGEEPKTKTDLGTAGDNYDEDDEEQKN